MRYLTAPRILPMDQDPLVDHVLVLDADGVIEALLPATEVTSDDIEHFPGTLVPGFVNAHGHLELSHLLGRFTEKEGLPAFIRAVLAGREATQEIIQEAIRRADAEMHAAGIVAMGDIGNTDHTLATKSESPIRYHSFVELLGFDPDKAEDIFRQGLGLLGRFREAGLSASLVPHAPYTMSPELTGRITAHCREEAVVTSIHMLESNDENEFSIQGTGAYRKLFHDIGIRLDHYDPPGSTSLEATLPHLDPTVPTLLVHNTIAITADVEHAMAAHPRLHWCFCPNANLFIEDRLPDLPLLLRSIPDERILLGTDSLASNWQLSVYEEVRTLRSAFPEIPGERMLRWATRNGADFLGWSDRYGTLSPGKRPGVVHLFEGQSTLVVA